LFPLENQDKVRRILVEECGEKDISSIAILDRVRFGALKLSRGNVDLLQVVVDDAKCDFRDVRMAVDFGDTEPYRARD
jgi:hypothetical protein